MSSKTQIEFAQRSDFGTRLREAFNYISNQAIADKIGVGKSTLTAYMQGRIPPPSKLLEIEKETQCNLTWLLTGKGSPKAQNSVERPQGIIFQGTKGGIGTSTCAVFVAINLALRGYGVLLANDVLNTCFDLLFSQKDTVESTSIGLADHYQHDYYVSTKHKNFDLFVPRTMHKIELPKDKIKPFVFDSSQMSKKYDFVIFDLQRAENPFYYPHHTQLENFYLEPILREAKVITPYKVLESIVDNVRRTSKYVEEQKRIYPAVDFSGMFLIQHERLRKSQAQNYEKELIRLKEEFKTRVLSPQIEFNPQLGGLINDIQKIMFSRKTKIHSNFSDLVDEILIRIDFQFD